MIPLAAIIRLTHVVLLDDSDWFLTGPTAYVYRSGRRTGLAQENTDLQQDFPVISPHSYSSGAGRDRDEELMTKEFHCRKEASRILSERGIPTAAATLAKLATTGGGPEMTKFGRRVFYTPASLEQWLASRLRKCGSTSEWTPE